MDRIGRKAKFYLMLAAFFLVFVLSAVFAARDGALAGLRAISICNTFMILFGFLLLNGSGDDER